MTDQDAQARSSVPNGQAPESAGDAAGGSAEQAPESAGDAAGRSIEQVERAPESARDAAGGLADSDAPPVSELSAEELAARARFQQFAGIGSKGSEEREALERLARSQERQPDIAVATESEPPPPVQLTSLPQVTEPAVFLRVIQETGERVIVFRGGMLAGEMTKIAFEFQDGYGQPIATISGDGTVTAATDLDSASLAFYQALATADLDALSAVTTKPPPPPPPPDEPGEG